jgi:cyclophilin family peptidyl-prolyl cis-trans isomerase
MKSKPLVILIIVLLIAVFSIGIFAMMSAANNAPASAAPPSPTPSASQNAGSSAQPPASNQSQSSQTNNQSQEIMKHLITIKTSLGNIEFATFDDDAPKTVNNFITLAQKGFYDNVIFHRVIKGFMIQGGDPTGTGRGGPGYSFDDELNSSTPSYQAGYIRGVVAMANAGPNTNGSQFFIMLQDTPLPHAYTIFGKVVSGQDVVDAIGNLPTDSNDRPLNPPVIESVTVAAE